MHMELQQTAGKQDQSWQQALTQDTQRFAFIMGNVHLGGSGKSLDPASPEYPD